MITSVVFPAHTNLRTPIIYMFCLDCRGHSISLRAKERSSMSDNLQIEVGLDISLIKSQEPQCSRSV